MKGTWNVTDIIFSDILWGKEAHAVKLFLLRMLAYMHCPL